jgi:hypothetical protein
MGNTPTPQQIVPPDASQAMTPMLSPSGAAGEIPAHRVADAVKEGFTIAAKLVSPSGKVGAVPIDRVHEALKAGFSPYVPTEEQAAATPAVAPVPLPGAGQKILGGTFPSPLDPTQNMKMGMQPNEQPLGTPLAPMGAAASIPQAIGSLAGGIGGSKLGEYIGEKSKLSPSETIWARDLGGVLGAFAGAGGGAQAESIWSGIKNTFAKKLYTEEGDLTKFADTLVHPTKLPENALRSIFPDPGEPERAAELANEQRAQDLMRRGKEQATIDKAAARESKGTYVPGNAISSAPGTPTTSTPSGEPTGSGPTTSTGPNAQLVTKLRSAAVVPPAPGSLQEAVGQAMSEPGKIIDPNSAEAKAPSIKGSYWSFPEDKLLQAAKDGDREAAIIAKMRGIQLPQNMKYISDVADSLIKGLYKSSK